MKLRGQVAIVTGGTSGIGAATARGLAAEGAALVIGGRNRERGELVADETGGLFQQADITSVSDCRALAQRAVDEFGRIDLLVNSAGIMPLGQVVEVTEDAFDKAWKANVKGTYFCGQAVIPQMLKQGKGRIVNFTSVAGLTGVSGGSVYCTTKGAIVTMTKAWAVELAPHGLNVNAIAPGTVETPMNDALRSDPGFDALTRGATPQGRNGQTDDIVPVVVFLASDDAKWMNGSIVAVDGGWLA